PVTTTGPFNPSSVYGSPYRSRHRETHTSLPVIRRNELRALTGGPLGRAIEAPADSREPKRLRSAQRSKSTRNHPSSVALPTTRRPRAVYALVIAPSCSTRSPESHSFPPGLS